MSGSTGYVPKKRWAERKLRGKTRPGPLKVIHSGIAEYLRTCTDFFIISSLIFSRKRSFCKATCFFFLKKYRVMKNAPYAAVPDLRSAFFALRMGINMWL